VVQKKSVLKQIQITLECLISKFSYSILLRDVTQFTETVQSSSPPIPKKLNLVLHRTWYGKNKEKPEQKTSQEKEDGHCLTHDDIEIKALKYFP